MWKRRWIHHRSCEDARMARLEELTRGAALRGILPDSVVAVVDVAWYGSDAVSLTYKDAGGRPDVRLLYLPIEDGELFDACGAGISRSTSFAVAAATSIKAAGKRSTLPRRSTPCAATSPTPSTAKHQSRSCAGAPAGTPMGQPASAAGQAIRVWSGIAAPGR